MIYHLLLKSHTSAPDYMDECEADSVEDAALHFAKKLSIYPESYVSTDELIEHIYSK
jgi:hypothetical protein